MPGLQCTVGNTYQKVPLSEARWDRSGQFQKTHDWVLYVDVIEGSNRDLIERVSFDLGDSFSPQLFICSTPVYLNGNKWRFSTRQQTYGPVTALIKLRGAGGTVMHLEHEVTFGKQECNHGDAVYTFYEDRRIVPFRMLKLPSDFQFGIELELTTDSHISAETVADSVYSVDVDVIYDYHQGRTTSDKWKIVPDSSIMCSSSAPDCNRFELVAISGSAGW